MPNFPDSEQWMIGSGYVLLVIWSIGGPNLNEYSALFYASGSDPIWPWTPLSTEIGAFSLSWLPADEGIWRNRRQSPGIGKL